jgi:thiosulfate reductase cytochrome b subunit
MNEHKPDSGQEALTQVVMIRRHAIPTRVTHWINVVCFCVLLASGLQIFNAWPELYWGQTGNDSKHAVLEIGATKEGEHLKGFLRIGAGTIPTTGVLGVSRADGEQTQRAFPSWATLPSYQDLASGRRWHLFFAWCFVLNGMAYLAYAVISGHLRRDLLPRKTELAPRHLWHEVIDHARLRFPKDERARHYNALQKISYVVVICLLLPMMLISGAAMSPGINAALPWLLDLLGGRQSARTLHFTSASLLVAFVVIHLAMVVLSGLVNNLRSMITGRYAIQQRGQHE